MFIPGRDTIFFSQGGIRNSQGGKSPASPPLIRTLHSGKEKRGSDAVSATKPEAIQTCHELS